MDAFHKDNQWLEGDLAKYLAAFICYLYGNDILIRVEAPVHGNARFCVRIKECDLIVCKEEAANRTTPIMYVPFCESIGWVVSHLSLAKKSGVWSKGAQHNNGKK